MTLEEKRDLINSAESEEELAEAVEKIEADKEPEEIIEEAKEIVEEAEEEEIEKPEEAPEEITPEEERKLLKETIEERSAVVVKAIERKEEKEMEMRNSNEYIEAYADYVKGRKDAKELRALITTEGYSTGNTAVVEVPDIVADFVKTAWEREGLLAKVRKLAVKGNFKVQFEVSGSEATAHTEGQSAVSEEELVLGVVELKPESIKKWISISDEALDLRGEEFLRYIYDELTYRIAKKTADTLVYKISQLPATLQANGETGVYDKVSANKVTEAPAVGTIAKAIANLSDETSDITIVMNRLTWGAFKEAQKTANYDADIFEGCDVVFNNSLPAYASANGNAVYGIVGDFGHGAIANFPNGDNIDIKYDDTTLMTSDLVRILGRRYVAVEPVADKSFALLVKPASV